MKKIATIHEKDIYPNKTAATETAYFDRITVKAVVFDNENNVALVGNRQNIFFQLPGGGVDHDEDIKSGLVRECFEEIGCNVDPVSVVGCIDDYRTRDKKHCINYCYIANVVGIKGDPTYTDEEIKIGMYVKWVKFEEAINIFESQYSDLVQGKVQFYNTGFNILRDRLFLKEIVKNNKT